MDNMQKIEFSVSVVAATGTVDRDAVCAALEECANAHLDGNASAFAKARKGQVKGLSRQGYLVSRARVAKVTVAQAGDGANAKPVSDEVSA